MFSIGGVFVANIALARAQSASEYGEFAITYSLFTFLSGVHNGALLEAFTVYGSGRYRASFDSYWRFALKANLILCLCLAVLVAAGAMGVAIFKGLSSLRLYLVLSAVLPVLLTSIFMRRVLHVERRSVQAAWMALTFFASVVLLVFTASRLRVLTGSSLLMILAFGWVLAGPVFLWRHTNGIWRSDFSARNPDYLSYHWQYSKWVILTALVFQLTQQGYFWLAAILLDTTRVAELRAAWNLVQPATLVFASLSFVMLPRLANLIQTGVARGRLMNGEIVKYTSAVLAASLGCAALAFEFGDTAYQFVYAGKYSGSVKLLYVVALVPISVGIAGVFSDVLRAVEKPGVIFYAYVVGGLFTLIVGVPAILLRGVEGAAWGMVASNAGYAITIVLYYWWVGTRRAPQT